ncbi:acetyl-CoA carboxylase carboxyltransferase subunit alpha [Effusibacillus lacus]|uniref:Acetyl-coenzyme A carboxylase carboxyl transferase subunit alpha n=1 Tax=Effusibacillus lacus TaxID=1348429 RepID=A0A292YLX9_9BACL|nr:acetyl-CoA carboxylase carboxyltransferase subunit alpha [Effusibacillus lacus]TCS73639.1 acetyl-CoA carboxylase carboxyltransferase subunit alpha [Effusibacillus lacus]GAX89470.1 acetyl-CoA carboxylase carboxyltransferase subunit alpha [Effusibacillus lacus]
MANELHFEKPLTELRAKIEELRKFTEEKGIDFTDEIVKLERKAAELEQTIYGELTPWQKVQIARHADRPTTLDYIRGMCTDFIEMHGDRTFGDDPALVGGIAKLDGIPVTVLGHQKGRDTKENIYRRFGMPEPEGYRKALRLMKQAEKFGRPVICFIDTPGAYPGVAAEERGQSEAIARNLIEMAGLSVPIVCVVTGEGGSGGALALGVGDRIFMLEHAVYSVISPEGAAALLWKDASQAQRAAETMRITAQDLARFGIADGIIEEPMGGAQKDPDFTIAKVREKVVAAIRELLEVPVDELVEARYRKYKAIGRFHEEVADKAALNSDVVESEKVI